MPGPAQATATSARCSSPLAVVTQTPSGDVAQRGDDGAGPQRVGVRRAERLQARVGGQDTRVRFDERATGDGDAGVPGACGGRAEPLTRRPGRRHGGADRVERLVVTEGELTRDMQQAPAALVFEGVPEVACRKRHLDVVPLGIAEAEDASPAFGPRAGVADVSGRLEHLDGPPASRHGPGRRQSEHARPDDHAAAEGRHMAILGRPRRTRASLRSTRAQSG